MQFVTGPSDLLSAAVVLYETVHNFVDKFFFGGGGWTENDSADNAER